MIDDPAYFAGFPKLTSRKIKSPIDPSYNCFAFAVEITDIPWAPVKQGGVYWPAGVPFEDTLDAYSQAYASRGYEPCQSADIELGYEKIVIYELDGKPWHAARQLENGNWVSKMGSAVDIEHPEADSLEGPMGHVALIMRRERTQ